MVPDTCTYIPPSLEREEEREGGRRGEGGVGGGRMGRRRSGEGDHTVNLPAKLKRQVGV